MNTATAMTDAIAISTGFLDSERETIGRMYWEAFGAKLRIALHPQDKAVALLAGVVNPACALVARSSDGEMMGVAGYKTAQSCFVAIDFAALRRQFGVAGALWRGALLAMLDRAPESGTLLMDGIFVAANGRGKGVGTALLTAIKEKARDMGCDRVRLDVIDTNSGARRLYEREGFLPAGVRHLGPLRHLFGFSAATTMFCDVTLRPGSPAGAATA